MKKALGWQFPPGSLDRPLIIAHRGDSSGAPENTLAAFLRAVKVGADGVELDVRLTKEGEVAIMHDRTVDRTTTGRGAVGTFTVAQLKSLDAGSWFSPDFRGEAVPLLGEAFQALPPHFLINVELKVRGYGVKPLVDAVVRAIRSYERWDTTLVASFNPMALFALRLTEPRIMRGYIWSRRHPLPIRDRWLSPLAQPQWMDPDLDTFSPRLLARFHRQGKRVLAWDVDLEADMNWLAELRLDGVVTDYPEVLVKRLVAAES